MRTRGVERDGWLVGWYVDRTVGRSIDRQIVGSIDSLIGRLINRKTGLIYFFRDCIDELTGL